MSAVSNNVMPRVDRSVDHAVTLIDIGVAPPTEHHCPERELAHVHPAVAEHSRADAHERQTIPACCWNTKLSQ